MRLLRNAVALASLSGLAGVPRAHADATQVGAFIGPRFFSSDAYLGYLEYEDFHPHLRPGPSFGARIGRQFGLPYFVPEFELVYVPTRTTEVGGAAAAGVNWLEPRVHLRIELMPQRRVEPFVMIGGGAPIALSSARRTFNSGITGEGYIGAGFHFDTQAGFAFRLDARICAQPAATGILAIEGDVNVGVEFTFGGPKRRRGDEEQVVVAGPPPDKDEDGFPDKDDKCPDRAEDTDNFEDSDGCPEIDNDNDRVLDIADKCPTENENLNGFQDDDGCVDAVPPDVEALKGTIEGLIYGEGETGVRDSAQRSIGKIAAVMQAHPTIKVVLIGHTDDREAKAFVTPPAEGQPPPDVETIASDLSRARAEAVRQALVGAGVPAGRMVVDGVGAEEPVTDNGSPKGRLANRRVEIKLFVPR
jgi:outer membrane protein OmpA-like peptidoglycan-associated protein